MAGIGKIAGQAQVAELRPAIGGDEDVAKWPEYLDESRYKRFLRGYDSVYATSPELMLSVVEVQTIPWLMIEALIAEAVIPIANTGSFAKLEGAEFLKMVARKTAWIRDHSARLIAALEG